MQFTFFLKKGPFHIPVADTGNTAHYGLSLIVLTK